MTDATDNSVGEGPKSSLCCNFCDKSQYEVNKLLKGHNACICDECLELGMNAIRETAIRDLSNQKSAADRVAQMVADADCEVPGNPSIKLDLARMGVRRHAGRIDINGRTSGLFTGPLGCGIDRIIASIWSDVAGPVIMLDASQLRATRLFERRSIGLSLLQAADCNVER